jgi:UDP-N-acetylmuramoyl-tripeptide--D-alanyl-D-alanine ligase
MINLKHISHCSSSLKSFDQKGIYPFITDTRKYQHPSVFVAIPGAKTNPLDVIENILAQQCPLVIYQNNPENQEKVKNLSPKFPKTVFHPVSDSVLFLQELTHLHIQEWKEKSQKHIVFAISGSNGKTTHKEMLSFILNKILPGKIVATEKNNNNHLGVPLTLLNVTNNTEMIVLELGSNHPGEIKVLCDIATPNAGLTTNIGATHLEFFGTETKVFEEEGYLYHAVKDATHGEGYYLINLDDPFLSKLPLTKGSLTYGESALAQAQISFQEKGATVESAHQRLSVTNEHITGRHNKLNLITCAMIAAHFYPEYTNQIIEVAAEFRPTKNRSQWIQQQGKEIYLDAYNANPSSMMAALQGFKESVIEKGYRLEEALIVLGDMNELGDTATIYHQSVGNYVKELGFRNVIFIGRYASFYQKGFPQGLLKNSSAEFKQEYQKDFLPKYAIHFIKGSRSLQLESLFDIT